jgi:general secretion pathway protein D
MKRIAVLAAFCVAAFSAVAPAQDTAPAAATETSDDDMDVGQLIFKDSPVEIVLNDYANKTRRTLLLAPSLPKPNITLRSERSLAMKDYLHAIDSVLSMHGLAVLRVGEEFLKVVPIGQAGEEAMKISEVVGEDPLPERGQLVSQMITVRHIELADAQKAVDALKHKYAIVYPFPGINSLLVTDDSANINRILQVMKMIDQPIEIREEPNIIHILHAKPSDIKGKLEEIIADSQKNAEKKSVVARPRDSGQPGVIPPARTAVTPEGVIRAPRTTLPAVQPAESVIEDIIEEAERGVIRGNVKIVADDRTSILIIITRPENVPFFEKIIKVLDVTTKPDVEVLVVRLEYADAKQVASMLNDLIGAASKTEPPAAARGAGQTEGEAAALKEYADRLDQIRGQQREKSKIGELAKENIKILSDERTNALIIMASRADLLVLSEIIQDMDMMLSQVLIEAVILDITLSDTLSTGVDWLQRSMIAFNESPSGARTPISAFTGAGGGGVATPFHAALNNAPTPFSGLSYYFTFFGLNLDTVLQMAKSDKHVKVVSTPVILTTDNKEAKITSTDLMYVLGQVVQPSVAGQQPYNSYEQKEVGLEIVVKPHINENKVVMMDIRQKMSQPNAQAAGRRPEELAGTIIYSSRTLEAAIAVENRQTIVLGGLVSDRLNTTKGGIPLLSSIPFLGRLFGSDSRTKQKTETVVFITPYVLDTPEEIANESRRRKEAIRSEGLWTRGWSDSDLAEPTKRSARMSPAEVDLAARKKVLSARQDVLLARERELEMAQRERDVALRELELRQRELDIAQGKAGDTDGKDIAARRRALSDQESRVINSMRKLRASQEALDQAKSNDSEPASIDTDTANYIKEMERQLDKSIRKADEWAEDQVR